MASSGRTRTVCVIEDDIAVRESLTAVIEIGGSQAISFANAEEFRASDYWSTADFLIVDIRLPGMTGLELLESMVAYGHTPPVIVITGHADVEDLPLEFWPNRICVLPKPCDPNSLLSLIEDAGNA